MHRTDGRHVWKETVDALAFEPDAGPSTDGLELLHGALRQCLVHNAPENIQKLSCLLQQHWLSSDCAGAACSASPKVDPLGRAVEDLAVWQQDCHALLALLYVVFTGGRVTDGLLQLHVQQFVAKWFCCDDDLDVAASRVRPQLRTESLVAVALLYVHLLPMDSGTSGAVSDLLQDFTESPLVQSPAPQWLQDAIGGTEHSALPQLIAALTLSLQYKHRIPSVVQFLENEENFKHELQYVLNIVKEYQEWDTSKFSNKKKKILSQCVPPSEQRTSVSALVNPPKILAPEYQALLLWLNGLLAYDRGHLALATSQLRAALEHWPRFTDILFTAFLAYHRQGLRDAAMECLQLLLRSCDSATGSSGPCQPFSSALLAALLPRSVQQRAVTALIAVVYLRYKMHEEACDQLTALLSNASATDDCNAATTDVISERRTLLLPRHQPPSCVPARLVLQTQAAIATCRLGKQDSLNELLNSISATGPVCCRYYSRPPLHQLSCVSWLLCSLMRVDVQMQRGSNMTALRVATSLIEATQWVSLVSPDPSPSCLLLTMAPVLAKALLYWQLTKLHSLLDNSTNVRHFTRLKTQCLASVATLCSNDSAPDGGDADYCTIVDCGDERGGHENVDNLDSGEAQNNNLVHKVNVFCNVINSISGLDETCTIALKNVITFLTEEITKRSES